MRKPRVVFTDDLKQAVLREVELGRSVQAVATEFDVTPKSIYRWQKEFSAQKEAGSKTTKEYEAEIRVLRKRAERAEMEATILKKAVSIFSTSPGKD